MLNGIDISMWNAGEYSAIQSLDFVIARCSIGLSQDSRWNQHSAYVLAHPPVRLFAYHFADNRVDPVAQAKFALKIVGSKVHTLFLDREGMTDVTDRQASQIYAVWRAAGKIPGQYHSRSGYPYNLGQSVDWIAAWGQTPNGDYDFWQTTGSPQDRDVYNGTKQELAALAGMSSPALPLCSVIVRGLTPVYLSADGIVSGHITSGSYRAQKYTINGHYWYRILSSLNGGNTNIKNHWLPAEPTMTVQPLK